MRTVVFTTAVIASVVWMGAAATNAAPSMLELGNTSIKVATGERVGYRRRYYRRYGYPVPYAYYPPPYGYYLPPPEYAYPPDAGAPLTEGGYADAPPPDGDYADDAAPPNGDYGDEGDYGNTLPPDGDYADDAAPPERY